MGIETSVIHQHGRSTGRGAGGAWKAFGMRERVSIVHSIFRQSGGGARRAADAAARRLFAFRKVNQTGVRHPFETGRHREVRGSRPRLSANSDTFGKCQ
jgi:hypothetical protein